MKSFLEAIHGKLSGASDALKKAKANTPAAQPRGVASWQGGDGSEAFIASPSVRTSELESYGAIEPGAKRLLNKSPEFYEYNEDSDPVARYLKGVLSGDTGLKSTEQAEQGRARRYSELGSAALSAKGASNPYARNALRQMASRAPQYGLEQQRVDERQEMDMTREALEKHRANMVDNAAAMSQAQGDLASALQMAGIQDAGLIATQIGRGLDEVALRDKLRAAGMDIMQQNEMLRMANDIKRKQERHDNLMKGLMTGFGLIEKAGTFMAMA